MLLSVRDEALKSLEAARAEKRIGSGLEAQIHLAAPNSIYPVLSAIAISCDICSIVSERVVGRRRSSLPTASGSMSPRSSSRAMAP